MARLQLALLKRNQNGWSRIHSPLTHARGAKRDWLGKGFNNNSLPHAVADSFGKHYCDKARVTRFQKDGAGPHRYLFSSGGF